jgi:uncharacterized membrane protein YhhN
MTSSPALAPAAADPAHASAITPAAAALIIASLAVGMIYPFVETGLSATASVVAKGLCVGLLTLAALALASPLRWWLAAIMVAGTTGDVLLEVPGGFLFGAGAFAIGHIIAIVFYWQHRRDDSGPALRLGALALVGWGLVMPELVSPPGTPVGALMLYSVLLCGMAAALLCSRFSRLAVAGALLFVISDTLLIMRLGGRVVGDVEIHGVMIWLSYSIGQALILSGVACGLGRVATLGHPAA